MYSKLFTALALLVASGNARAQTNCPAPALSVLRDNQPVPATGSALAPAVTLELKPNPQCPPEMRYQFTHAEVTLMRGIRPATPTLIAAKPELSLSAFMPLYQDGDWLYIFIPYKNLRVVGADGQAQPYTAPVTGADSNADNGIGFSWPLSRK
ncbi:hypothetical protein [Hymenobacter jeollabukensis]|uniref:Uncharacterized protein n=1 Tax=Hymenobacter jeollabukensis TaxID=2025313 RepID=A0A5R8WWZ0_9BACT|nr:hypothetical protein [Hymenobacter jeollabukensis]TLM97031.1 hypothetical protein FDY95_03310 [Hymenobacter jeollabukensis]